MKISQLAKIVLKDLNIDYHLQVKSYLNTYMLNNIDNKEINNILSREFSNKFSGFLNSNNKIQIELEGVDTDINVYKGSIIVMTPKEFSNFLYTFESKIRLDEHLRNNWHKGD